MAVESVTATLLDDTEQLTETEKDLYSGELSTPNSPGTYGIAITAYDDGGNISVLDSSANSALQLNVELWRSPKTDWKPDDRFNIEDYNRIKNNLEYLHEEAVNLWKTFPFEDMGENLIEDQDEETPWDVNIFNMFEKNLEEINKNILTKDYGYSQTFFENGPFIKWDELNRIESAILSMKDILDRHKVSIRRLPFRLGTFKEGRI